MPAMNARFLLGASVLALLAAALPAQAEEEKVLNVYNWSDYIADDTLAKFAKETGIKVNYDTYDGNEALDAKLKAGKSRYDVVFPSATPYFQQQVAAGIYQRLDKAKLGNWSNLDPQVLKTIESADPGNQHGAPYMIAATGFGYNIDKIKAALPDAPTDSWAMLFNPEVVGKFKKCGVTLLDSADEVLPAALNFMGRNPVSQSPEDLKAAGETVAKARPFLKYIHSSKYINDLANGDICLAHGYVGDLVQARNRAGEAGKKVRIGIAIPKEGARVNIDVMAVPTDAPHPENAHKFIDFLMRPDIIADITNKTGFANAIPASLEKVEAEIRNDPVIYPSAEMRAKEYTIPPAAKDFERQRSRLWTEIKTRK